MKPEAYVLISGTSSGIGAACAHMLDQMGFRVFAGVRKTADGEALRHQTSQRLEPVLLDVTDEQSIRNTATHIAQTVGNAGLAGLVNNAGIAVASPLEFIPLDAWRRQLEVNVTGQLAVTQALLPLLRQARGRVVNIGSLGGFLASPFVGAYTASKFAMEGLTDTLRMELRPWGIEVALIVPGVIATPIWSTSLAAADKLLNQMSPQAVELYGPAMNAVRTKAYPAGGTSPNAVAKAIARALTTQRPRTRYPVGLDAQLGILLTYLPDRWRDRIICSRQVGKTLERPPK
ncbi:MAG: SDR family NAD(P)-dependent oxidoreductase [Ktedonobacteraceae bacterium]|nr:SDR family NAD(P)-dependent oxidoreductase [Ktedonobacteraceae bacterium]